MIAAHADRKTEPQNYAGSGVSGPCLTDAAQRLLPANRSWCRRYAPVRTDPKAVIAAIFPGGIMQTSRACFAVPPHPYERHSLRFGLAAENVKLVTAPSS